MANKDSLPPSFFLLSRGGPDVLPMHIEGNPCLYLLMFLKGKKIVLAFPFDFFPLSLRNPPSAAIPKR